MITGTRYMNIQGMLPYENKTANYIKSTGNHVMYRVTPVFEGDNLVATGVLMEAYSVEDKGQGLCFNVFCWNSLPGVIIDYATGDNRHDENYDVNILDSIVEDIDEPLVVDSEKTDNSDEQSQTYILNTNTKKIHYPWCSSVDDMAEHNKQEFAGDINELIGQGYSPCKRCNPT
ncbi:DNA/RNA non-specific endonuclease [Ruminococcus albus]|uniref:DNA/RNA non-specific endonuclease n=1 Tax=Ruminococcus albus TaxID=1264 RepID=UPI000466C0C6